MNNRILDIDCCGCSACATICPTQAIHMGFNEVGAYTPTIDDGKCISCKKCEEVCTVFNADSQPLNELSEKNVFVGVAKDKSVLNRSASGGLGYVFGKRAIEMSIPVCAVTYDMNDDCATHILVDQVEKLKLVQGSKYLQSANQDGFRKIASEEKGIVFGTPCQIVGMDAVLRKKKKREKFILIDIFCHGVPSQLLWKQHLKWLGSKKKISDYSEIIFRQGKQYRLKIGQYNAWYNEDAFFTFFLRGWIKNHRCYYCHLRRKSCADIRIGDCMTRKYNKLSFSPSCIIANTELGLQFLTLCASDLDLFKEKYDTVDGIQERENMELPAQREHYLKELQKGVSPNDLLKRTLFFGRIKSFIKNRLFAPIFNNEIDELSIINEQKINMFRGEN